MRRNAFLASGALCLYLAACGGDPAGGSGGSSGSGGPGGSGVGATTGSGGATGSGGGDTGGGGPGPGGKWVGGYYVGYQQDLYPPEAIDWDGLTHLMIGRVTPNQDGTLNTTFDIDPASGPELAKKLSSLAHQNGKKAVVMLGGAGEHEGFASAASAANRADFVENLVALANEYGFDGFDIDWEPIETVDQPDLLALTQALRAAMPGGILTIPVGWVNANFPDVDPFFADMAALVDQVNIMSYSMAGAWDGWQSWHSSALYGEKGNTPTSVDASVKAYLAAGVPAEKLGVGIGFYGSCWTPPVTEPGQPVTGSWIAADDNVMSYANILSTYYTPEARHWDEGARAPYLSFASPKGPQGCSYISYEDEESILEKAAYVKQQGLGGAIVWTIGQGYRSDQPAGERDPLMKALAKGFLQ